MKGEEKLENNSSQSEWRRWYWDTKWQAGLDHGRAKRSQPIWFLFLSFNSFGHNTKTQRASLSMVSNKFARQSTTSEEGMHVCQIMTIIIWDIFAVCHSWLTINTWGMTPFTFLYRNLQWKWQNKTIYRHYLAVCLSEVAASAGVFLKVAWPSNPFCMETFSKNWKTSSLTIYRLLSACQKLLRAFLLKWCFLSAAHSTPCGMTQCYWASTPFWIETFFETGKTKNGFAIYRNLWQSKVAASAGISLKVGKLLLKLAKQMAWQYTACLSKLVRQRAFSLSCT